MPLAPVTFEKVTWMLKSLVNPWLGKRPIGEIEPPELLSVLRRIESRGTRDFPTYQGRKLYGELTMNIHVDARGRVVETDIVQSSGNAVLDRRAVAIVRASAPFGNFTTQMRQGAELLVITSRFRFTRDENLETTLSGQPS